MKKVGAAIKKVFDKIAQCVTPMMPVFVGCGMLKVINVLLGPQALGVFTEDSPTFLVLQFVAEAGYYFIPVFVGISTAEAFHTNKFLGALMGAILLSPDFVNYVEQGVHLDVLGLEVVATSYGSQMIPAILCTIVLSFVYNFFDAHSPVQIKNILAPLLTIVIMIPVDLCIVGPLGYKLGQVIMVGVMWLMNLGPVGPAIISVLVPFQVMFGVGSINLTVMLLLLAEGPDPGFFYSMVVFNICLGITTMGVYLRSKNPDHLAAGLTACVAGIGEPSIFGCMISHPKALVSLCIADFIGTYYGVMMGVKSFAIGSCGLFGIATFIGENSNVLQGIIGIVIACVIGFVLSFFLHKNEPKYETK